MFLRANPHSEDSISDDDDHYANLLSLQNHATNKQQQEQQQLPLPARLDLLKERFCNHNSSSSFQSLEDEEVEMPDFNEGDNRDVLGEVVADSDDEDTVSDNEKLLEDEEVEMPDFNEGDNRNELGEVVADSDDEDNVSEDEGSTILSTRLLQKYGPQFIRNDEVKDAKRKSEALLCFQESASSHATFSKANSSGTCTKKNASFWVRAQFTCNSLLKLKIFVSGASC